MAYFPSRMDTWCPSCVLPREFHIGGQPCTDQIERAEMNPLERAKQYAAIFLNAGEKWRDHVPVDATVKGDTVYLQDVCMERVSSGWRLTENGKDVTTYIVAGRGR